MLLPAAEYLRQNQPNHAAHREHACKFDPLRYFSDLCKQIPACNHKGVVKRAEKAADNSKQNQKPVPSKRNRFGLVTEHCILPEKQLGNEIGNHAGNDRHTQHGFVKRFVDLFQNEHNAGERRVECRCKPAPAPELSMRSSVVLSALVIRAAPFAAHGAELHAWAFSAEAEAGEYGNGAAEQFAKNHFPPIRRDSAPYFRRYLRYTAACRIGHFFIIRATRIPIAASAQIHSADIKGLLLPHLLLYTDILPLLKAENGKERRQAPRQFRFSIPLMISRNPSYFLFFSCLIVLFSFYIHL